MTVVNRKKKRNIYRMHQKDILPLSRLGKPLVLCNRESVQVFFDRLIYRNSLQSSRRFAIKLYLHLEHFPLTAIYVDAQTSVQVQDGKWLGFSESHRSQQPPWLCHTDGRGQWWPRTRRIRRNLRGEGVCHHGSGFEWSWWRREAEIGVLVATLPFKR